MRLDTRHLAAALCLCFAGAAVHSAVQARWDMGLARREVVGMDGLGLMVPYVGALFAGAFALVLTLVAAGLLVARDAPLTVFPAGVLTLVGLACAASLGGETPSPGDPGLRLVGQAAAWGHVLLALALVVRRGAQARPTP